MRLIIGLGNPGREYLDTPHNAGFRVCERFAERHALGSPQKKFRGEFQRGRVQGEDIGVLRPQTYMNLSGESVQEALRYLPAEVEDLIVVWDELDLPLGKLRIGRGGGHGGHNGVRSVINHVGSRDFPRLRVGVGRPTRPGQDPKDHLLSKGAKQHREWLDKAIDIAAEALDSMIFEGVDEAMNRYNGLPAMSDDKEAEA